MKEYIMPIDDTAFDWDEMFVGVIRKQEELIRCKDCGQREYGCSTFIDHNQIYGFCAWGWKTERKEE